MSPFLRSFVVAGLLACNTKNPAPRVVGPADAARSVVPPDAPLAPDAAVGSELDAFLATLVADVTAAPDDAALNAIADRARALADVKDVRFTAGSPVPIAIVLRSPLDAEHVVAKLGWTVADAYVDGLDQHRSIPEVVIKASPKARSERPIAGAWRFEVSIEQRGTPHPGPDPQVGKPLVGSGAVVDGFRIWRPRK